MRFFTIMTGSDGKDLPAVEWKNLRSARKAMQNIQLLGYECRIETK